MANKQSKKRKSLSAQLNEAVCLYICRNYYSKRIQGKNGFYLLHPRFCLPYLVRFIIICWKLVSLSPDVRNAYRCFTREIRYEATVKPLSLKKKIKNLFFTVLGLHFFSRQTYQAWFYADTNLQFDRPESPVLSIIISARGGIQHTITCLKSLKYHTHGGAVPYELIVVDNGSANVIPQLMDLCPGITYLRNEKSADHWNAFEIGIKHASAALICKLDSHTLVQEGLIEQLAETAAIMPEASVIIPMHICPHGLLDNAGGVLFHDGTIKPYGRMDDTRRSTYNFLRETDVSAGPVMLLRKADYYTVQPMLHHFATIDYQHADLCLSIRHKLGKKIYFQPLAKVVNNNEHSPANGRGTAGFTLQWRDQLTQHYAAPGNIAEALERYRNKPAITVIDSYLPFFDKESGSRRIFELLKILRSLNYQVRFIPHDCKYVDPYASILSNLGIETAYRYLSRRQRKKTIDRFGRDSDILWVCRPDLNLKYQYLLKRYPHLKWIYDTIDLHYLRLTRALTLYPDDTTLKKQIAYFRQLEPAFAKRADITICITEDEAEEFSKEGAFKTVVIPNIHQLQPEIENPEGVREGLLFIGSYKHKPNEDAALWLCETIMPLIWKVKPNMTVTLLGSDTTERLLSIRDKRIRIPGYVQDVAPYFYRARIFAAPLRYGAGMKGKIGQSLEYRLPVITTVIGAEGMGLVDGKHVLIAHDEHDFARQILRLYDDPILWKAISEAAPGALAPFTTASIRVTVENMINGLKKKSG